MFADEKDNPAPKLNLGATGAGEVLDVSPKLGERNDGPGWAPPKSPSSIGNVKALEEDGAAEDNAGTGKALTFKELPLLLLSSSAIGGTPKGLCRKENDGEVVLLPNPPDATTPLPPARRPPRKGDDDGEIPELGGVPGGGK